MNYTPYHFFVASYEIEYPPDPPQTIKTLFKTQDGERLYLGDSYQATFRRYLQNIQIVKDYGYSTDESHEEQIVAQYKRDFPPTPCDIDALEVKDVDGWLSPDGVFYQCEYQGHSNLAIDLAESFLDTIHDDGYDESLYRAGWLGIGHITIISGMRLYDTLPTEQQIVWLKRLAEHNKDFGRYADNIKRFIESAEIRQQRLA